MCSGERTAVDAGGQPARAHEHDGEPLGGGQVAEREHEVSGRRRGLAARLVELQAQLVRRARARQQEVGLEARRANRHLAHRRDAAAAAGRLARGLRRAPRESEQRARRAALHRQERHLDALRLEPVDRHACERKRRVREAQVRVAARAVLSARRQLRAVRLQREA